MAPSAPAARRLYVIPAADAPIAAVFLRMSSKRWHVLRWEIDRGVVESGAWFVGQMYPRRANLSPDGALLGYFVYVGSPSRSWPKAYFAVSKLPWLTALAAWENSGTWSWGCEFKPAGGLVVSGEIFEKKPFHGSWAGSFETNLLHRQEEVNWGERDLHLEEERGWTRASADGFATALENRSIKHRLRPRALIKERPKSGHRLIVVSRGTDFKNAVEGAVVDYLLEAPQGEPIRLEDAAWADWDRKGRLLVATLAGELQIRDLDRKSGRWNPSWSKDLASLKPQRTRSPDWARRW
jgi:hypothetical protein